ncbi:hypothetical protein O0I10_011464 [Lichtheimia ornata]|uniref:Secreted protein n=1 Tax=Lichtheimia ornata TaxID=688661 RepID=A0AAD7XQF7_9FUNG|nr:uncharacterized protein O0I10_011464 [Lichtheimia ornata]KAJ8652864.1 hypothetical protein O0I10_011464 [Lichtheimia ornata]
MKSSFLGAIIIAIGVINNVSAVQYVDKETFKYYQNKCHDTPFEKCDTVGYCIPDQAYNGDLKLVQNCLIDFKKYDVSGSPPAGMVRDEIDY